MRALALLSLAAMALMATASAETPHLIPGHRIHADPSLSGPPIAFAAELSPDEQSALVESPASGRADFTLDRATLTLSWRITFQDLTSAPLKANIHGPQTPGGNAQALIDLAPAGLSSPLEGSVVLSDGQLRYLLTDRTYINLTTRTYKDGELRGHIKRLRTSPTQ